MAHEIVHPFPVFKDLILVRPCHLLLEAFVPLRRDDTVPEPLNKMNYVKNVKRIGIKKGMQQGMQRGGVKLLALQIPKRFRVKRDESFRLLEGLSAEDVEGLGGYYRYGRSRRTPCLDQHATDGPGLAREGFGRRKDAGRRDKRDLRG